MAGVSHAVYVAGSDTLLVIHEPVPRRMGFPEQVGYEGMHSRGGKKHRRVVFRNQGLPLNLGVSVPDKKFNVLGTQFVGIHEHIIVKNRLPNKPPRCPDIYRQMVSVMEGYLNSRGLRISDKYPLPIPDPMPNPIQTPKRNFCECLDGRTNATDADVRILVSTAADTDCIIKDFKKYCDAHKPYNAVISAIRDKGDEQRANFLLTIGVTSSDYVIEIPMGKVRGGEKADITALQWYNQAIDVLAHTILGSTPFLS
jgi:hypothetical protein